MIQARCWGPCATCGCTVTALEDFLLRVDFVDDLGVKWHQLIDCSDSEGWEDNLELLDNGVCPVCDGWEDGAGDPVRPDRFGILDTPCGVWRFEDGC